MLSDTNKIREVIDEAELLLIGIGEEHRIDKEAVLQENEIYKSLNSGSHTFSNEELELIYDCIFQHEIEMGTSPLLLKKEAFYRSLGQLIQGKEHYIVTLATDDLAQKELPEGVHIVAPCGSDRRLQCCACCGAEPVEANEIWSNLYKALQKRMELGCQEDSAVRELLPRCKNCGEWMAANVIGRKKYDESGYQKDWEKYTGWLSRTLNKKVCLLELGVGFLYPTVIRWPFEKITTLNQKAVLVRVHETFYQTAKEIQERSFSRKEKSEGWIQEVTGYDEHE